MATLVLTVVGSALGGSTGAAIGAYIGQQIDQNILFKPKDREGPKLQDLAVQTSQYGSAVPRLYGAMRVAGSVIWATDLIERAERQGGGKGRPGTTTYHYSVSLAAALSSRPILSIGRIWAEGNLLRGGAGDLKGPVALRAYTGHGDQPADPLMASAEGAGQCPAHRGTAYAVLEDFDLADYGNRIPSLTFEVFADAGAVHLVDVIADLVPLSAASIAPQLLDGFAATGDSVAGILGSVASALPLLADARPEGLVIKSVGAAASYAPMVAIDSADLALSGDASPASPASPASAIRQTRQSSHIVPRDVHLRYYDASRDYQAGLRRSSIASRGTATEYIELPAVLTATAAQMVAEQILHLRRVSQNRADVLLAVLDPAMRPGSLVALPDIAGVWRVQAWEWRGQAVMLALVRHTDTPQPASTLTEPGRAISAPDASSGETVLRLIDLPTDYGVRADSAQIGIAAAGTGAGWRGAALLMQDAAANITETGQYVRQAAGFGTAGTALPAASPHLVDRRHSLDVTLLNAAMTLQNADARQLAQGANLAAIGNEIVQFGRAEAQGNAIWRLSELWRGRGGTEHFVTGHLADEAFLLLDARIQRLDPTFNRGSGPVEILALGVGDAEPVAFGLAQSGRAVQPWSPVHGMYHWLADGGMRLDWTRRSRAGHAWRDAIDVPLAEEFEDWRLTLVASGIILQRSTTSAGYTIAKADLVALAAGGEMLTVSIAQAGQYALSPPLTLSLPNQHYIP